MKHITDATSRTKAFPNIFPGRTGSRRGIFNLNYSKNNKKV